MFDATSFEAPKTKDAVALLAPWRSERPALVVLAPAEDNAGLSFRNVQRTSVVSVGRARGRRPPAGPDAARVEGRPDHAERR